MSAAEIGPQLGGSPVRGWLAFEWLPDDLQRAEDSTAENDLAQRHWLYRVRERPATLAERILLQHIGFSDLPDDLITRVEFVSGSVRNRRWPALEQIGDTP